MKHSLIRTSVQRSLQGTDCRGDRRMHIRQRCRGHTRGKSRSVQLVISMQDQCDVQRSLGGGRGLRAIQHEQKIGRMRKRPVRLDDRLALADPVRSEERRVGKEWKTRWWTEEE